MKNITIPSREIEEAKFIQVYLKTDNEREPFLRYCHFFGGYHAILLRDFLTSQKRDYENTPKNPRVPMFEGNRYELCGAGRMSFKDGLFTFWGSSSDYNGLESNEEHFIALQRIEPRFKFRINKNRPV